jgi:hypothetical protein
MRNPLEGAQDEVEKLVGAIAVAIDSWSGSTDRSEEFKRGVAMSALCNSLVLWSVLHEVSAELVIRSVINTLHVNGAFGDDDDDETVH